MTVNDVTTDAVDLIRAAHQGDVIGYARITNQLRRTQTGPAVTRELAELFLDILRGIHDDDDTAVKQWLDEFALEWLRTKDTDTHV